MVQVIKFALRPNLKYPFQLIIWHLLRKLETILISYLFNFGDSLFYIPLMFIGEFLSGLIFYNYQNKFFKKEKEKESKEISDTLLHNEIILSYTDSDRKIKILIAFVAYFDWIQFIIYLVTVPKYKYVSNSIVSRLSGILAISSAFFYSYVIKIKIFKHHKFSLAIIGICTIIVIVTEFFFQEINIFFSYWNFIMVFLLSILSQVLNAFLDSIEKYLFEYDYVNPFYALMYEGIYGFFMTFFYFTIPDYLDDIKNVYKTYSAGELILFTFLLLLYIVLCGGRNIFRVITTKIYSPMTRGLTDYFINPIYYIYDYSLGNDFIKQGEKDFNYFLINLIISLIISFCGCVYNEFIVLFCCGLERNTHDQISIRASEFHYELNKVNDASENNDDD
jgi:hypothetical protein